MSGNILWETNSPLPLMYLPPSHGTLHGVAWWVQVLTQFLSRSLQASRQSRAGRRTSADIPRFQEIKGRTPQTPGWTGAGTSWGSGRWHWMALTVTPSPRLVILCHQHSSCSPAASQNSHTNIKRFLPTLQTRRVSQDPKKHTGWSRFGVPKINPCSDESKHTGGRDL